MKFRQIISFGLDVYKRFATQKISKDTYKEVTQAVRYGCSKEEWLMIGYKLGIIEAT
mgnify:CR=1 FL=1